MGQPYKRNGRQNYYFEFRDQHGTLRKNVNLWVTDKKVAHQLAAKIEEDVDRLKAGLPLKHSSTTGIFLGLSQVGPGRADWVTVCEQYLAEKRRQGCTALEQISYILERFGREVGWKTFADVKIEDVQRWFAERAHLAPKTQNNYLAGLRTFGKWAEEQGYFGQRDGQPLGNVFLRVKRCKAGDRSRVMVRRALLVEEIEHLCQAALNSKEATGPVRFVAYQVMAFAGFRRIELRRLIREDCSPQLVRPRWHVRPEVTKNGQPANLPMTQECARALLPWWEKTQPGALLFPVGLTTIKPFNRDRLRAGIPLRDARGRVATYHSLRYTFCSLMAKVQPIETVCKLMRHGSLNLTQGVYLDLGLDKLGDGEWTLPPLLEKSLPNPLPEPDAIVVSDDTAWPYSF